MTWEIDPAHSHVSFAIRVMSVSIEIELETVQQSLEVQEEVAPTSAGSR